MTGILMQILGQLAAGTIVYGIGAFLFRDYAKAKVTHR